ncbi:MAG: hypothetical protein DME25_19325, partial [Verrucomicrobia bacterium]
MKPVILLAAWAVLSGLSLNAEAGGTVNFANNGFTRIISSRSGNPVSTNDGVKAALYWSPLNSNSFVQIGATVANVGYPLAGLF